MSLVPLYGLDRLTLNARVLLVNTQQDADAAQAIVGGRYVVLSMPSGADMEQTNLSVLRGHKLLLWPTATPQGIDRMVSIAEWFYKECPEVKILSTEGMPNGWSASSSGFEWSEFMSWAKPRAKVYLGTEQLPPLPVKKTPPPHGIALWEELGLSVTDKGQPHMNLDNVVRVIEADPSMAGHIWYDEFLDAIVTTWQGPERKWKDADDVLLQLYMQRNIGLTSIKLQTCHDAATVAAFHDTRNECRSWLESLEWDGKPRLKSLMSDGFGAVDNPYMQAVGRCWVMSMVARVMNPGCKVDTVPVFEGGQGDGKSTALSILGGKWFVECHESVLSKDFYGVLQGHMLVEISEMHSFTRAEVERVKGIISCQVDRYRKAYGRNTEDHKRHTVLACTTNQDDWQRDVTGARRFWPVAVGTIWHDWLRAARDLLFAEAVQLYLNGDAWWDVPFDAQVAEVEARRDSDSWEHIIGAWLHNQSRPTTSDILLECLKIEVGRHDQMVQKRVSRVMKVLGWKQHVTKTTGRNIRAWVRSDV